MPFLSDITQRLPLYHFANTHNPATIILFIVGALLLTTPLGLAANDPGHDSLYILRGGDNVSGVFNFSNAVYVGTPTQPEQATTKAYVDSTVATNSLWTNSSGNATYTAGNVGIQTTSPDYDLDVEGDIQTNRLAVNGGFTGSEVARLNGEVKIGNSLWMGSNANIRAGGSVFISRGSGPQGAEIRIAPDGYYDDVSIFTNGNRRLYVNGSGLVGIGTTTPKATLDIAGTSGQTLPYFRIANGSGTTLAQLNDRGGLELFYDGGANEIAIGSGAMVDNRGIAIGQNANAGANSNPSFAIGNGASAENGWSTAIGNSATSDGFSGVAVGQSANAGSGAVAIGRNANTGNSAVAVGNNADASSSDSVAIGQGSFADFNGAISIGKSATATTSNQLIIGSNASRITEARIGVTGATTPSLLFANQTGVGIGTESISNRLDVNGTAAVNELCLNGDCRTTFTNASGSTGWSSDGSTTSTSQNVDVGSGNFYVDGSTGNLGIGTSSPNKDIQIIGNFINFTIDTSQNAKTILESDYSGNSELVLRSKDVTLDTSTGSVSIDRPSNALYDSLEIQRFDSDRNDRQAIDIIREDGSSIFAVTGTGNVGIGNRQPTNKLFVDGSANISGNIYYGGNLTARSADVAENFYGDDELVPGEVVVADPSGEERVKRSTKQFDTSVLGIVSTDPAVVLGEGRGSVPLALSGRVPVKASAENGAIQVGDLLTTAGTDGHVMRCSGREECFGSLVGKAVSSLDAGTGEVIAVVTLG